MLRGRINYQLESNPQGLSTNRELPMNQQLRDGVMSVKSDQGKTCMGSKLIIISETIGLSIHHFNLLYILFYGCLPKHIYLCNPTSANFQHLAILMIGTVNWKTVAQGGYELESGLRQRSVNFVRGVFVTFQCFYVFVFGKSLHCRYVVNNVQNGLFEEKIEKDRR